MFIMCKDLMNSKILSSIDPSKTGECASSNMTNIYDKGKEFAINLIDEINTLRYQVVDSQIYKGIITSFAYYLPTKINIKQEQDISRSNITIRMTGQEILEKLSKIPDLILTFINIGSEYINKHNTDLDINKISENILISVVNYELAALSFIKIIRENLPTSTNEAVIHEENVAQYTDELNDIINEIRNYYEENDYSKILSPRKKKIDKIEEYMKGALDRKYKLRVPLYKIQEVNKKTRDVVENNFIKDVKKIIDKYDNFALLTPDWDENEDMYIYLTLKEPFGEKGDKKVRENIKLENYDGSKNKITNESVYLLYESILPSKKRKELKDSDFGIPELRKFPLTDESHIRSAIKMFKYAKPKYKEELARNIAKAVSTKKLKGKVFVLASNPFAEYFPGYMIQQPKNKKKKVELNESISTGIYKSVFDEDGKLY